MLKEFKEFIVKGNAFDLAVGVIIGGAFGAMAGSFVSDVMMPPIGLVTGGTDFSNLFLTLKEGASPGPYSSLAAAKEAGAVTLNLGVFFNTVVNLVIVGFVLFLMVRAINAARTPPPAPPPATRSRSSDDATGDRFGSCPRPRFRLPAGRESFQVTADVHRAVEHADHLHLSVGRRPVRQAIVAVQKYPHLGVLGVAVPDFRKLRQLIGLRVDGQDQAIRSGLVLFGDVVVDGLQAPTRFVGPDYLRHVSMSARSASCSTTRPASASASPRSTMQANASSRSNSSIELSSGCASRTLRS